MYVRDVGTVQDTSDIPTGYALVNGRRAVYAQTASKSGTTPDAAGQATGAQLIGRTPAGQFIKPLGGAWTKK